MVPLKHTAQPGPSPCRKQLACSRAVPSAAGAQAAGCSRCCLMRRSREGKQQLYTEQLFQTREGPWELVVTESWTGHI